MIMILGFVSGIMDIIVTTWLIESQIREVDLEKKLEMENRQKLKHQGICSRIQDTSAARASRQRTYQVWGYF